MIVDQPHRLHEGIDRGRSDEFPALLFERLRQGNRFRRGRYGLRFYKPRPIRLVSPEEGGQRAVPIDEVPRPPRIVDGRLDLAAMADDAVVREQAPDIAVGEARDPVEIEITERRAEVLALGEDGALVVWIRHMIPL